MEKERTKGTRRVSKRDAVYFEFLMDLDVKCNYKIREQSEASFPLLLKGNSIFLAADYSLVFRTFSVALCNFNESNLISSFIGKQQHL